jgi:hypothetical protein
LSWYNYIALAHAPPRVHTLASESTHEQRARTNREHALYGPYNLLYKFKNLAGESTNLKWFPACMMLSSYPRQKGVRAACPEARWPRGYRKRLRLFCGYSSRRFSSVSSLLLQGLKSPYDFLNFNGDFTTIETARKRSMKRLSNAQARCQLWRLR